MMMGAMAGNIAVRGAGVVNLSPGAMVRLRDVDNLRVMATNKGLMLQAGDNGRRGVSMVWKGNACKGGAAKANAKAAKASAKASKAAAKAAKAKAAAAAASKSAAPAASMAASAKSMAASAKAIAAGAGAAPTMAVTPAAAAAPGAVAATGATAAKAAGLSLGLGLGLGALGPVLLLGALGISGYGLYKYGKRQEREEL